MFARKHVVSCFKFTKTRKTLLMFVAPSELCAKCYDFVFKNEFLSLSHNPHHITVVITNVKSKNIAYAKKHLYLNLNENLNIYMEI